MPPASPDAAARRGQSAAAPALLVDESISSGEGIAVAIKPSRQAGRWSARMPLRGPAAGRVFVIHQGYGAGARASVRVPLRSCCSGSGQTAPVTAAAVPETAAPQRRIVIARVAAENRAGDLRLDPQTRRPLAFK